MADFDEQVSFEPHIEEEERPETVSFLPDPNRFAGDEIPDDEEVIQTRAEKTEIADQGYEGRREGGKDVAADAIRSGSESQLRDNLLGKRSMDLRETKQQFLRESALVAQTAPSAAAVREFLAFTPDEVTNKKTVTESLFAREMLAGLESSVASQEEDPVAHESMVQTLEGIFTKKEYLQQKLETIDKRLDQRGLLETAQNLVGELAVPGRQRILLRGAQTEAGQRGPVNESFARSSFTEEQSTVLMLLGNKEFVNNVDATVESLWESNPGVAKTWLEAMLTRSTSDDLFTDIWDVVDLSSFVDVPLLGGAVARKLLLKKGIGKVVKGQVAKGKGLGLSKKKPGSPSKPLTKGVPTGPAGRSYLKAAIDNIKTLGAKRMDIPDIEAARGAPTRAAAKRGLAELQTGLYKNLSTVNTVAAVRRLLKDLPTLMTPGKITAGSSKLANEEKRRLTAYLDRNADLALRAATRTRLVNGRPQEAVEAGLEETLERFRTSYKGQANDVLDTYDATPIGNTTNVLTAGIRIGDNGKSFKGKHAFSQAEQHAKHLGIQNFKITKTGENVTIDAFLTIDETTPLFRQQLVNANPTPLSFRNMAGSLLFGNDEQVSAAFRQNAKVAVLAQNNYSAFAKEIFRPIRAGMTRNQKKDLEHYLEVQRAHENFDKNGVLKGIGRFDDTIGEFERNFEKVNGRFPEANESLGYFTFRQLNDLDLLTNNFGVFRDKARKGVERHILQRVSRVKAVDQDGIPKLIPTGGIEGKRIKLNEFDFSDVDSRILFHNPVSANANGKALTSLRTGRDFTDGELEKLVHEAVQNENAQIIRLNSDGQRVAADEFKDVLGGDVPDFIITNRVKTGPIELSQIPNNPGGHNIYPDGSFLKQGNVLTTKRGLRYAGDRALVNLPYHPDAVKLAKTMEEVRKLVKVEAGKVRIDDSKAFLAAVGKTPFGETRVKGWFKPDANGESFLNVDQPIIAARSGERTTDLLADHYKALKVRIKKNDLDEGVSADFATHRDKPLVTIVGSEDSPSFDIRHNQFTPAFATLQNSLDTIANNRFMDDFKFKAQDQFIAEFGDLLDDVGNLTGLEHALTNPLDSAMRGKLKTKAVDPKRLAAAKSQQRILKQIMGTETDTQKAIRQFYQHTIDGIYSRFGEKGVKLVPDHALPLITDPAQYMRNLAFHMKLGLFNPVQLFLQAQGSVNMVALAGPKVAWASAPAAGQFMRLGFTGRKEIVKAFAEKHSKMGGGFSWEAKHFEEAYNFLSESGFMRVGGEVAQRNTQRAARLDRGKLGTAFDKSTILFDKGEQFNRAMGYAASYRKWRDANPKAAFNKLAQDQVLDVADTFSGNMTRVSNAAWQKGFLSIPTQFFAYQARIAEQMLPKFLGGATRITAAEKVRMFGVYSIMYGVPTATGTLTAVVPWYDVVREELLKRGMANPDTGSAVTDEVLFALNQGIVSTAIRQASHGLDALGIDPGIENVNFADRFGPGGLDVFTDVWDGDKSLFEGLTGVSGSVLTDIFETASPLAMDIVQAFSGDPVAAPMLAMDAANLFSNVSGFSAVTRFFMDVTTRQYYTRNATLLNDEEKPVLESMLNGLTGLSRLDTADDFLRVKMGRIKKAAQREGSKTVGKWLRRAFIPGTSDELRDELIKRAGNLALTTQLDRRQIKSILRQNLKGIPLSETAGAQFAEEFGGGDPAVTDKLLADSERGRN